VVDQSDDDACDRTDRKSRKLLEPYEVGISLYDLTRNDKLREGGIRGEEMDELPPYPAEASNEIHKSSSYNRRILLEARDQ
jgi:hypothetical protein